MLYSFGMDISVPSSVDSTRIVNLGLVSLRNSIQMVSGFGVLCGLIMVVFGARTMELRIADDYMACPACAELVRVEARICKHCRSEIEHASQPLVATKTMGEDADLTYLSGVLILAAVVGTLLFRYF
jgi:hypothetical protein